ncbi:hypothetical protein GV054_10210 [Marinomonas mediterranea]|uniref:hypothetical protein n=1 Tax=Marinomonas mediterranea TaxID=119864 RepID=UPI00234BB6A8|nr:hypothetical protein [Marinomonas mediterranea]WCN13355.1 hypothetical protein GV054_10210 [Marinomonas mediterranea]
MKNRYAVLAPVALGVLLSACSTTSKESESQLGQTDVNTVPVLSSDNNIPTGESDSNLNQEGAESSSTSNSEELAQANEKIALLEAKLQNRETNIAMLESKIAQNNETISQLHVQLDEKDRRILAISEASSNSVENLDELERTRAERDELENEYASLKLENEQLRDQLLAFSEENAKLSNELAGARTELALLNNQDTPSAGDPNSKASSDSSQTPPKIDDSPNPEFIALNESFRTLDSAHLALSKNYRDLQLQYADMKSQHDLLSEQNENNRSEIGRLKKENLRLGGALSEARAQHQVLWDKIRVQSDVIASLESDNARLSQASNIVVNAQSANTQLPSASNERGDLAAQSPISTGTNATTLPEASLTNPPQTDKAEASDQSLLNAKIARLEAEVEAQNRVISDYQSQVFALEATLQKGDGAYEALEEKWRVLAQALENAQQENRLLMAELRAVERMLAKSEEKQDELSQSLEALNTEKQALLESIGQLEELAQTRSEEKAALEAQVNNLIPFEGAVLSLQTQLKSKISDVSWTIPEKAIVNDVFEVLVSANIENPVLGQTYLADLYVDSSIDMLSAREAEAVVEEGAVSFRWRLGGLAEIPKATVNLVITQQMNYQEDIIKRPVFKGENSLQLQNNNLFEKYGLWGIAILAALGGGFLVGKLGRPKA